MNVYAVIDVQNRDGVIAQHGEEAYELLHGKLRARLQGWLRKQDQLTVENGGRLCALLAGVDDVGQVNLAASKLINLTEPAYDCFGSAVKLHVIAGFTFTGAADDTREAAIARADTALNQARDARAAYRLFSAEETTGTDKERSMADRLRVATERGEFVLFFQPKISVAYDSFVGAEALMRWAPKPDTLIMPDRFIPIAERYDLIKPLSLWATKSSVARCADWQGDVGVSVNVPPTVLQDDDLLATVEDTLALYDLAPGRLTIEVTETQLAENPELLFAKLAALRERGVRVAIDDFGTGYASLAYFRHLPADEIKIDKSFILNMRTSPTDDAIVRTVIDLCHKLSLRVVAEGIEDKATVERLREYGCDVMQGFHLDKPLPPEVLEQRYRLV